MDYGRLFKVPNPSSATFLDDINPDSLTTLKAIAEPAILAHSDQRFQFERQGYFCKDPQAQGDLPVFNKTVSLREGFTHPPESVTMMEAVPGTACRTRMCC